MTMQTLSQTDLNHVVRRLPKDVCDTMREYGLVVGGGFIRETISGGVPKDIDFFGGSKEILGLVAKLMAEKRGGRVHATDNAYTLLAPPRMPVQFITRWLYTEPQQVVESFDFTVCQAVIWFDKDKKKFQSMCSAEFYPDLAARRLVYTFPRREEEAGGSLMRIVKFLQRGWNIQSYSLAGAISRVALKVRWDQIEKDSESEKFATQVITGLLREVDPLSVVDGLEPVNEHESAEQVAAAMEGRQE
jgi:hypothetical protein